MFDDVNYDSMMSTQAAMSPKEFARGLQESYARDTVRESVGALVDDVWPIAMTGEGVPVRRSGEFSSLAPSYRDHQKKAVVDLLIELYINDNGLVELSAPTGAGKSVILDAVMLAVEKIGGRDSFFSTPINNLIDQVDEDDFMSPDVITLKGRSNYNCVHPEDMGTSVDKAICQRDDNFECELKTTSCPYYSRKERAKSHPRLVTNLAYLIVNSMIPEEYGFPARELMQIDEVQSTESFVLGQVGVTITANSVPITWEDDCIPPRLNEVGDAVNWIRGKLLPAIARKLQTYETAGQLTESEASTRDALENKQRQLQNFLTDVAKDEEEHEWALEYESGRSKKRFKVSLQPVLVGRFMHSFLWSQAHKFVLSSATIPPGSFHRDIGIQGMDTEKVEVPSTFPIANRPVWTNHEVGKMTYTEEDTSLPKAVDKLVSIANGRRDRKGFVHCGSYRRQQQIYDRLPPSVKKRTMTHDSDGRESTLREWKDKSPDEDGGQIFLSVAMTEGISLDGDVCRWQVIMKAEYPNRSSSRVMKRWDMSDGWTWAKGQVAVALQQAVGRGVRSEDDWCECFVLDKSATKILDEQSWFESWFLPSIDPDETHEKIEQQ